VCVCKERRACESGGRFFLALWGAPANGHWFLADVLSTATPGNASS
jgi:hypothetical protein